MSLLVPMSTRSYRSPIVPYGGAVLYRIASGGEGGRSLVLTRFFMAGSPLSALRGARSGVSDFDA